MSKPVVPPVEPRPTDPSDRLNSWKDVAAFLGKGVRTVQRWEDELDMPVHRLGKDRGEIVFAFKSEIARWQASIELPKANGGRLNGHSAEGHDAQPNASSAPAHLAPQPSASPPPAVRLSGQARQTVRHILVAGSLAAGVAAAAWFAVGAWRTTDRAVVVEAAEPQPAHWKVEDDRLKVFEAGRNLLWEQHFPSGLGTAAYIATRPVDRSVVIDDLDGDGQREVVFVQRTASRSERRLHVFNADGSTRFVHQPTATVRFGDTTYGAPWLAHFLSVTKAATGPSVWAGFIHGMWFPTVLHQLDQKGRVLSEYWSNGYVTFVGTETWHGRRVVLVGATNNEHRGASLAIFEAGQVTGAAPAANPRYRCEEGCPPGRPLAFVVFPRACMPRADDTQPFVEEAWVDGRDQIVVLVENGRTKGQGGLLLPASVYYTLGSDLTPVRVELTRQFHMAHSRLERTGLLDHAFGEEDLEALFPFLTWEGDRFVELPRAPVVR